MQRTAFPGLTSQRQLVNLGSLAGRFLHTSKLQQPLGQQLSQRHIVGGLQQYCVSAETAETEPVITQIDGENFKYQAEVSKLLDLIVNSIYSNKDIFLRELISNASDALDKVRFMSLNDQKYLKDDESMEIRIRAFEDANRIDIEDTGIGMTHDDLVSSLGTIARSGTAKFQELLKQAQKGDEQSLIGQFGVGFYSSFLVAARVQVRTKSPEDESQWVWESEAGKSEFTIRKDEDADNKLTRGTRISLYLKEESDEYLEQERLEELIKQYSEFIRFPIKLWKTTEEPVQEEDAEATEKKQKEEDEKAEKEERDAKTVEPVMKTTYEKRSDWEVMNRQQPIWARTPSEVSKDEYNSFFKSTFNEFVDPITYKHFKAEGTVEFQSLLYLPGRAPMEQADLMKKQKNIKLFVRRVFISDEFDEDLVPRYMCFVKGIVDSADLPLNVSREILQQSRVTRAINKQLIRRTIEMIGELKGRDDRSEFDTFWENFGRFIKLGVIEDQDNKVKLADFLKFYSSKSGDTQAFLDEYVGRMKEGQKKIFYLAADNLDAAKQAPFVEKLLKKDYEVLYFVEPIDELMCLNLGKYKDLEFLDVTKEELELEDEESEKETLKEAGERLKALTEFLQNQLGAKVEKVVVSNRLEDSPCTLVTTKWGWSASMEKTMRQQTMGDQSSVDFMVGKKILEINPEAELIKQMDQRVADGDTDTAGGMAQLMYETCLLTSGFDIKQPREYATRVFDMMLKMEQESNGSAAAAPAADGKPTDSSPPIVEPEVIKPDS